MGEQIEKSEPLDQKFWSLRYVNKLTGWDLGACSPPLRDYFDQLNKKDQKILIPGAGQAHEARYLIEQRFSEVHVLDLAQEPLQNLLSICPDYPKEHMHQMALFEHQGQYDLIIEQTFFCAIDPALRDNYVKKMRELLRPGGKLIGVLFNRKFDSGPPFGGNLNEYIALFSTSFKDVLIEPCYNSIPARSGNELFIRIS